VSRRAARSRSELARKLFDQLSRAEQDEALGADLAEAVRNGEVEVGDLVTEGTSKGTATAEVSRPPRPAFLPAVLTTYATTLGVAVLSFGSVLITARVLGATGRGSVAFLTTMAFLTSQLATLGIFQADANIAAREPDLTRSLAGTSVVLSALFGWLAGGVVAALVAIFPAVGAGSEPGLIALVLATLPLMVLQPCLDQLLRAHYIFGLPNVATVMQPLLNVGVVAVLAIAGVLTVESAVVTWVVTVSIGTMILAWGVVRRLGGFGRYDAGLARRMLGFGIQAHAGRVMTLGNYRLDQWILGAVAGPRELGLYTVAVAWVDALFFLPTALTLVQRPDLVRASPAEAERQASVVFRGALLITLILMIGMIVLAPFLCVTAFGESFRDSIEMLRVLALGAFGIVALKLLGNALTAQRKPLLETAAISGAFVCTIALDVILIPSHGGLGAAIASSVAYTLGGVLVALIFTRALKGRLGDLVPRGSELGWVWLRARARFRAGGSPSPREISPADGSARDPAPTRKGDGGDE
jgi:O-antigen/teichoic acid export membrane protein